MDQDVMLQYALHYAQSGIRILPVRPDHTKLPAIKAWQHNATNEAKQIERWWGRDFRGYNIGALMGYDSNLMALDLDRHDADGVKVLHEWMAGPGYEMPDGVPVVSTPRNGQHHYFAYDPRFKNTKQTGILQGVDILAGRAFILLPPSEINGNAYAVDCEMGNWSAFLRGERVSPPEWLVELFYSRSFRPRLNDHDLDRFYNDGSLKYIDLNATHGEGERELSLFKMACCLRGQGPPYLDVDLATAQLSQYNETHCDPPMGDLHDDLGFNETIEDWCQSKIEHVWATFPPGRGEEQAVQVLTLEQAQVRAERESRKLVYTLGEVYDAEVPPQKIFIEGVLTTGLTIVGGDAKSGKSFLMIQMVESLISGQPFLGREVLIPCGVWYLALEDTIKRLKDRLRHHVGDDFARNYGDRGHFTFGREYQAVFRSMLNKEGREQFFEMADTLGVEVVIIDTFTKACGGIDQNAVEAVAASLEPFQEWASDHDKAIVIVDHKTKSASNDGSMKELAGSRAKGATCDHGLILNINDVMEGGKRKRAKLSISGRDLEPDEPHLTWNRDDNMKWSLSSPWERNGGRDIVFLAAVKIALENIAQERGMAAPSQTAGKIIANLPDDLRKEVVAASGSRDILNETNLRNRLRNLSAVEGKVDPTKGLMVYERPRGKGMSSFFGLNPHMDQDLKERLGLQCQVLQGEEIDSDDEQEV